jgi:ferric-dicitrate binding protein FerR (iron transport regulator)
MAMQFAHLSGSSSPAAAAPEVGHVMAVSGQGYAGNTPVRRLRAEDSLQMGDRVWTETESRASLMLDLGAVVHMGPEAHLILDRFVAESRGVLTLGGGAIVFDRDDELPRINLQIRSAFAQIGLRGTRFFAGPNRGVFAIFVERGSVRVVAGGERVILRDGDGVDIAAPGAQASEVTRWQPPRIAEAFESVLP